MRMLAKTHIGFTSIKGVGKQHNSYSGDKSLYLIA